MMLRAFLIAALAGVGALLLLSSPAKADGPTRDDCVADLDGDGDTDLSDLGILVPYWGCPDWPPPPCLGDLDGDGDTDEADLGILLADWGCGTDDPGCDGEPSDALQFDVVPVDNSAVQPGDDPEAPHFAGGVTHFTFDLQVIVTDDNDWTAAQAEFALTHPDPVFFDHPVGWDLPPYTWAFDLFPALEFDSFYTGPEEFPNGDDVNWTLCVGYPTNEPQLKFATWFDVAHSGEGIFTIARYTIVVPDGSATIPSVVAEGGGGGAPILGTLTGVATSYNTLGDCNEFAFDLIVGQCRGDLDGDYDIDQADLGILLADWGCTGGGCPGDCNGDGDTDQADLGILLAHWGQECP
ncbi:MAG TPA: hypothetical protein VM243_09590 [Phycisphaerae bacterium]|nr:hypothetical protein [Phycisphaerae bacterium]